MGRSDPDWLALLGVGSPTVHRHPATEKRQRPETRHPQNACNYEITRAFARCVPALKFGTRLA
jgi:hypothetical protein